MLVRFVPSLCDGKAYDGYLMIRNLSFDERLEIYEILGLDSMPADDGEQRKMGLKVIREISKRSSDFVKEVNIKRLSDGHEIKSWDEIKYDPDMVGLIVEVCTKILGKIRAGI